MTGEVCLGGGVDQIGLVLLVAFGVDQFQKQVRLQEPQVRVAFHDVLDAPLSPVEYVIVQIVGLEVV